jgi:hypothetical protein
MQPIFDRDAVTLAGMIHELTKDAPTDKPLVQRISFTAIFCAGQLAVLRYLENYELYYFELTNEPGFALPQSLQARAAGPFGDSMLRRKMEIPKRSIDDCSAFLFINRLRQMERQKSPVTDQKESMARS